ncbi:hypothetical protein EPI10_020072 [Gossypium australe]|uniref:Uncharacterized protein n=1 Tax=Gossypium australe TaxID=47621 RepID=A0A5B6WFJ3_9ROSI|nr:hypothetical protein EPI10_020072 [Gossypium australe]
MAIFCETLEECDLVIWDSWDNGLHGREVDYQKIMSENGLIGESFYETNRDEIPLKLEELGNKLAIWMRQNYVNRREALTSLTSLLNKLDLVDPGEDSLAELVEVKLTLNMEVDK